MNKRLSRLTGGGEILPLFAVLLFLRFFQLTKNKKL